MSYLVKYEHVVQIIMRLIAVTFINSFVRVKADQCPGSFMSGIVVVKIAVYAFILLDKPECLTDVVDGVQYDIVTFI